MRFDLEVVGSLARIIQAEIKASEKAVTAGVRQATDGLKTELRSQVTSAGLGARLAKTWRGEVYPKGQDSIGAAGLVWSKAPKIIHVHDTGATIRSRDGVYLAIPTDAAGRAHGNKRMTPARWEAQTGQRLRFVYRRGGPSLLVADTMRARAGMRGGFAVASATAQRTGRGLTTVPVFILVPQVTLRKRLDIAGAANRWIGRVPDLIVGSWEDNP